MMTNVSMPISQFRYTLPSGRADEYAAQALDILKKIEKLDVSLLKYFLAANTALTLSGVRAFDTYISLDTLQPHQIESITDLLKSEGLTLLPYVSEYPEATEDIYGLIHERALKEIPRSYSLSSVWVEPRPPYTFDRLMAWTYLIEGRLNQEMEADRLPKAWLQNYWWAAHNIRFGILLGYPGEAIAGGCWVDAIHTSTGKETPTQIATIAYHDAYDAAQPTYYFPSESKNNPNIIGHQKLWSDILTAVYESEWHQHVKLLLN